MNKAQSYIYVVVVVLLLIGGVVYWSNKQEITPVLDKEPVVDQARTVNSIDSSNWKTFRHEVYPYEIKYPEGGDISEQLLPTITPTSVKNEVEIIIKTASTTQYMYIYVVNPNFSDAKISLKEYLTSRRKRSLEEPSDGVPMSISDAESISVNGWSGSKETVTYEIGSGDDVMTEIFILNNNILYRITYKEKDTITSAMLNTLRFLK